MNEVEVIEGFWTVDLINCRENIIQESRCDYCHKDLDEYLSTDRTNYFWEKCCGSPDCNTYKIYHHEMRCSEHCGNTVRDK